ncbi:MAG TPA: maleylpyruvate isomerase family mycothiol-dependent enzyme [Euzebya sp.]|nr:maleylpyruvate isomerase family mycothiol-dependent enzyme [Euzebya sp.]
MARPVHRQRDILCDLLESLSDLQWQAETMCEGWDAGDMVAHLLVRERDIWGSAGAVVPPLSRLHGARMARRKARGRAVLIRQLRNGPPPWVTFGLFGRIQVAEDYIHTEDIRRGGATAFDGDADLTPDDGTADGATDELLWQAIGRFALKTFAGFGADGVLAMTDGGRTRAYQLGGAVPLPARDGQADVTVNGTAGELLLFTTGRRNADVTVNGEQAMMTALEASGRSV